MQERGLSAYLAELIGTLLLVFFITSVVVLYVSTGGQSSFGSDFAVVGLVHAFLLFGLIVMFGVVSGGLLTKGLLLDEGRATNYGATAVSGLLAGDLAGMIVEGIGTFVLVLVIHTAVYSEKRFKEWAPLAIGTTLGFAVMVAGPLTGAALNPARWFGPALVSSEWGGVWPYLVGPILGSLLAAGTYRFVLEPGGLPPTEPPEHVRPPVPKRATPTSDKPAT